MNTEKTIAIVGAGVSGALTAYHLLRKQAQARAIVIDPRSELGLGLAYSTPSLEHLLNVPAGKISAIPDQPDHFLLWLQKNYDAKATASYFAPRAVFGRYIQSLLQAVSGIEHLRTSVQSCRIVSDQVVLNLADGTELIADTVVFAIGNFDPAPLPGVAEETIANGVYCHSAWANATYAGLPADAPVALIGSGLTTVDVLLRLRETGHRGQITAISRHGIFPYRHAPYDPLSQSVIDGEAPVKARDLLHRVHQAIKQGGDWRAVVDCLRTRTNELWLALPVVEQKRFRRHLQRRWDVVRHRMAPSIADRIEAELEVGTLALHRGSLHAVLPSPDGARVQFRTADGDVKELAATRVINCTGPNMNYRRVGSSLLDSLFAQGLAVAGPLGSGLWTDSNGALRNQDELFSDILFHVGPGRQGTLLESIAVPELRCQAAAMATLLVDRSQTPAHAEQDEAAGQISDSDETKRMRSIRISAIDAMASL
ncbi:hydroxyacylglutathione hydrolase [Silvibacterium bohemicum]|uniref:Hydroxyacylglutathione hydrolase n=1 Tax=Silvibacterium bohemicum TaxID=1577686 RepID=A0A841JX14_9BACT|nr:FAD/NAD(P)-binding protein [Silvibacterium bohemicum]MBB6145953.1 hydroxyacylglutathione hydrolase [Silvibacterium bohemicum]